MWKIRDIETFVLLFLLHQRLWFKVDSENKIVMTSLYDSAYFWII